MLMAMPIGAALSLAVTVCVPLVDDMSLQQ